MTSGCALILVCMNCPIMSKISEQIARMRSDTDCVVCWTEADNSIQTRCNHIYCLDCFENQVAFTASSNKEYSLQCQRTSERCNTVFTLSELQDLLSSTVFEDILESFFIFYIHHHLYIFCYCSILNCKQIYHIQDLMQSYICSWCVISICMCCHIAHKSMTCAEYKDVKSGRYEVFEKLKKEWEFKNCLKCKTMMEKMKEWNHMMCSDCHAHICWVCLKTFTQSGPCYEHMNKKHGGIELDDLDYDDWNWRDSLVTSILFFWGLFLRVWRFPVEKLW